jgi:hypothetical protein
MTGGVAAWAAGIAGSGVENPAIVSISGHAVRFVMKERDRVDPRWKRCRA